MMLLFMSFATASVKKGETEEKDRGSIGGGRERVTAEVKLPEQIKETELKAVWTIFDPKKKPLWD